MAHWMDACELVSDVIKKSYAAAWYVCGSDVLDVLEYDWPDTAHAYIVMEIEHTLLPTQE